MKPRTLPCRNSREAFSLLEVLAVVSLMGIVAAIVMPRLSSHSQDVKINACHINRGNIEVQAELWFRNRGKWPASNLSDIGATDRYFPDGMPSCPVDDSRYTIDRSTGRIIGHDHDR
jgi:general secretion pathway protein G